MKHSYKTGFSFGLTSGIITTLGLIVGLHSGTHSKLAVIGGVLIIAIADAFSDALGIHVSEESERKHSNKQIWESTISTFLSKFVFAGTFIFPIILFNFKTAILISILWAIVLLSVFSFFIAKSKNANPYKSVLEHLLIAGLVILITNYLGIWISSVCI